MLLGNADPAIPNLRFLQSAASLLSITGPPGHHRAGVFDFIVGAKRLRAVSTE
jgi:hypothetical protein